jgi:hypothetical protein
MKNRLLTLAGTLALLAVLGKFYAVPVLAQVRAALVKNIDERGRIPYSQTAFCNSSGSNTCQVFFPVVPPNKRLVIEHVNGLLVTNVTLGLVYVSGNLNSSPETTEQPILFGLQSSFGDFTYIANEPFLTYFEAGQSPAIFIQVAVGAGFIESQVTLTGYLVDLTQ